MAIVSDERLGDHDIRAADLLSLSAINTEFVVGPLRPHPKTELRDLSTTRIDVDTVKVVREDESWDGPPKHLNARVVGGESRACGFALGALRIGVCLLVDR